MKRKLDETHNIIQLYTHHAGVSEVPPEFHLWACISLIAACVSDRVWFHKFKSAKLLPNLFTFLLGPSGCGKGESIGMATKYVKDLDIVGMFAGNATAQYLVKRMGSTYTDDFGNEKQRNKMYLVTEELAMSVGSGPQAEDFVRYMTALYKGDDVAFEKGTITGGHVKVKDMCLNWLAGTTVEWAVKCIPQDAIQGGFLGRVAIVDGKYDPNLRIVRPKYPWDYSEIRDHLLERFAELTQFHGEFRMSRRAQLIEEQWYVHRPAPEDDLMLPTWKRAHDLCLKLAMILALAELRLHDELVIRARHVEVAQQLVLQSHAAAPKLQAAAATTRDSDIVETVRRVLERAGTIQRAALQRKLSPRGIHKDAMDMALATLVTEERVRPKQNGRAMLYEYITRRVH